MGTSAESQETSGPMRGLPRLLYLGDIPVAATAASSALLHRLLLEYPTDRLRVLESNLMAAPPAGSRLQGVVHSRFDLPMVRLLESRLERIYGWYLFRRSRLDARRLVRRIRAEVWLPEAILTVPHYQSWLIAAEVAVRLSVPLHLIVHDDVFPNMHLPWKMRPAFERRFGEVYRSSASRFCVSAFMAEQYKTRYGAAGTVLYPSRPPGPDYEQPAAQVAAQRPFLRFVFAGSLYIPGYIDSLRIFAGVLKTRGHRLMIYSNLEQKYAEQTGLDGEHVALLPMMPRQELIRKLREEADVLYAPMSFAESDRVNMEVCFLSKLTDYTAVGLPMLIVGPAYGSAVRWARSEPGVAEVVESLEPADMDEAIRRLEQPEERMSLARSAISVGRRYFSYERAQQIFSDRLRDVSTD